MSNYSLKHEIKKIQTFFIQVNDLYNETHKNFAYDIQFLIFQAVEIRSSRNFLQNYLSKEKDVAQQKGQHYQPSYPRYIIFYDNRLNLFDMIFIFFMFQEEIRCSTRFLPSHFAKEKDVYIKSKFKTRKIIIHLVKVRLFHPLKNIKSNILTTTKYLSFILFKSFQVWSRTKKSFNQSNIANWIQL